VGLPPRAGRRGAILKELIGWLESAPDVPVLWYSSYERRLLKRLKALGLPAPEPLRTGVDVFGECFRRYKLALPTENFDLKAAAEAAGFKFRHPELDGLAVAHRYLDWLGRGGDEAELKTLLEYGEDDVLALRALTQRLDRLGCCRP
jgi:predicted RecB family nuclease